MKKQKLTTGITLFILGFVGILSLLTMDIPLSEQTLELLHTRFTPGQIRLLMLVNPAIMLIIAVTAGTLFYDKVSLSVPVITGLIMRDRSFDKASILKYGITGGIITGAFLTVIPLVFNPILPQDFIELGNRLKPTLAVRFLYGGFTEEILMRFGLMTFVIRLLSWIFRSKGATVYWAGISIAALLFAIGHFPVAFQAVGNPSGLLIGYILVGNMAGGMVFGWLYWKKGIETAFIAHIFAHVIMVTAELF